MIFAVTEKGRASKNERNTFVKTYFYDCYDENFKPITQIFCKDTKELLEEVPNVRYLLCMDFMVGRCFKKVSENGVGCIVKELDFIRRL